MFFKRLNWKSQFIFLVSVWGMFFGSTTVFGQFNYTVPSVDLGQLSVWDFSDEEIYFARHYVLKKNIPFLLKHFKTVADSVVSSGPYRGWIDISVWRGDQNQNYYNARVMENHLAFAYFYCTDRPWNPYYDHLAVKERLEAVLTYWLGLQHSDRSFPGKSWDQHGVAPTAFATKFMGRTLMLLEHNPPSIDSTLYEDVKNAQRAAIMWVLNNGYGASCKNQPANVWFGALSYLDLFGPDAEMSDLLDRRLATSMTDYQSVVGYFYEAGGPDWSYNFGTHEINLSAAWHFARDTYREQYFIDKVQLFYEWASYNCLREPDGSFFVVNHEISTRKSGTRQFVYQYTSVAEKADNARAFMRSQEEVEDTIANMRIDTGENWPNIPELPVGEFNAYMPYDFLGRGLFAWHPNNSQKNDSLGNVRYLYEKRFIHQRKCPTKNMTFTYVKRPSYYAAFNSGDIQNSSQRFGLGIVWSAHAGSLIGSTYNDNNRVWGTKKDGNPKAYEGSDFYPSFKIDGNTVSVQEGNHDLSDGVLTVEYPLDSSGDKLISFNEDAISVAISHSGGFKEYFPILKKPGDSINIGSGIIEHKRDNVVIQTITFEPASNSVTHAGYSLNFRDKKLTVYHISASESLNYTIQFYKRGIIGY